MNLPYHEWWKSNSGQVIILVSQVIWNQLIEDAFYSSESADKLANLYKVWVEKLTQLSQNVTSDMEPWQRLALESLLTIEVHARDVIKDLAEKQVVILLSHSLVYRSKVLLYDLYHRSFPW